MLGRGFVWKVPTGSKTTNETMHEDEATAGGIQRRGEEAIKKCCLIKIASEVRIMELNVTDWELFLWLYPEYGRKVFNGFANELMAINIILLSMKSFMSSGKLSFLFERKYRNYFEQQRKNKKI